MELYQPVIFRYSSKFRLVVKSSLYFRPKQFEILDKLMIKYGIDQFIL